MSSADPDAYAALVLPGGVINGDFVRADADAVAFVKAFFDAGKPVAAICHAPWVLVEADVVKGRRMTSWPSLQTDLRNAGAEWVDEEVVVDGNLITSRKPDDLDAFGAAIVEEFARARPTTRRTPTTDAAARRGQDRRPSSPAAGAIVSRVPGEHEDGEQAGADRLAALPLPPRPRRRSPAPVTASGASRTATCGRFSQSSGGREVDPDAGGQGDDQLTGEAQPGERALLRRRVEVRRRRRDCSGRTTGMGPVCGCGSTGRPSR